MTSVINNTEQAIFAAEWCSENLINDNWNVAIGGLPNCRKYIFTFNNDRDYILFTLKWV